MHMQGHIHLGVIQAEDDELPSLDEARDEALCRTHLLDVLLDPVVHAVNAVPPYVGLFRDERPGLQSIIVYNDGGII